MKIYLDHAATTPLLPDVMESMIPFYLHAYGNPESLHQFGDHASDALEQSRIQLLHMLGDPEGKLIFTGSGTEANNLALFGICRKYKNRGNHIIVSATEHPSVLSPALQLEKEGFRVSIAPVDRHGIIDLDQLQRLINENTILVSVMHANNETGVFQPVEQIAEIIRSARDSAAKKTPFFHCDAVQTTGKIRYNTQNLGVDLLSFSAHKFYGPKGTGGLYLRRGVHIQPQLFGGGQEYGLRSGTHNTAGVIGMAAALKKSLDELESSRKQIREWNRMIRSSFEKIKEIHITCLPEHTLETHIHLRMEKVEGQAIMQELSKRGIAVSTGSACHAGKSDPSHVMKAMGYSDEEAHQGVRITLGKTNTREQIEYFIREMEDLVRYFKQMY